MQAILQCYRSQNRASLPALIVVDVQYDFISGSLAVKGAEDILPVIYDLLDKHDWDLVVASQDFHPSGHVSFASTHGLSPFQPIEIPHPITGGLHAQAAATGSDTQAQTITQMLWPDHCVQGTRGCDLEDGLRARLGGLGDKVHIVQKGNHPQIDGYSAFAMNHYVQFTALPQILFSHGITRLTIVGLATDYCVRATAIDARKFHFDVDVVRDGVRGVDISSEESVLRELEQWGCKII
ncbi:Isochorismatase hydrolase [Punctularia strigosozonata HHB-11173 SS5]|uniref:Isochorismatase hydrolase n=1 Tax=Punctularia strigosozonata (strain HHB-11173) TaxID=741275 RepID=UPI000441723D|nr:Isochorismatase hydrolase [Punctularia strigosozonata HHB-11173 SS5]EIN14268.1 Isochorismatase hydrolase [Punctularia strigosozonata HHB-11173 SS5]